MVKRIFADDGTEFTSEVDCILYERMLEIEKTTAKVADDSGNLISVRSAFVEDKDDSFDDVRYISAETPEEYEHLFEMMYSGCGILIPSPDRIPGYPIDLYYDDAADEWRSFSDLESEYNRRARAFAKMEGLL